MSSKYFPKDCHEDCQYFRRWDLSVDDYTNVCTKLGLQIDDMDAYGPFYIPRFCPISTDGKEKEEC